MALLSKPTRSLLVIQPYQGISRLENLKKSVTIVRTRYLRGTTTRGSEIREDVDEHLPTFVEGRRVEYAATQAARGRGGSKTAIRKSRKPKSRKSHATSRSQKRLDVIKDLSRQRRQQSTASSKPSLNINRNERASRSRETKPIIMTRKNAPNPLSSPVGAGSVTMTILLDKMPQALIDNGVDVNNPMIVSCMDFYPTQKKLGEIGLTAHGKILESRAASSHVLRDAAATVLFELADPGTVETPALLEKGRIDEFHARWKMYRDDDDPASVPNPYSSFYEMQERIRNCTGYGLTKQVHKDLQSLVLFYHSVKRAAVMLDVQHPSVADGFKWHMINTMSQLAGFRSLKVNVDVTDTNIVWDTKRLRTINLSRIMNDRWQSNRVNAKPPTAGSGYGSYTAMSAGASIPDGAYDEFLPEAFDFKKYVKNELLLNGIMSDSTHFSNTKILVQMINDLKQTLTVGSIHLTDQMSDVRVADNDPFKIHTSFTPPRVSNVNCGFRKGAWSESYAQTNNEYFWRYNGICPEVASAQWVKTYGDITVQLKGYDSFWDDFTKALTPTQRIIQICNSISKEVTISRGMAEAKVPDASGKAYDIFETVRGAVVKQENPATAHTAVIQMFDSLFCSAGGTPGSVGDVVTKTMSGPPAWNPSGTGGVWTMPNGKYGYRRSLMDQVGGPVQAYELPGAPEYNCLWFEPHDIEGTDVEHGTGGVIGTAGRWVMLDMPMKSTSYDRLVSTDAATEDADNTITDINMTKYFQHLRDLWVKRIRHNASDTFTAIRRLFGLDEPYRPIQLAYFDNDPNNAYIDGEFKSFGPSESVFNNTSKIPKGMTSGYVEASGHLMPDWMFCQAMTVLSRMSSGLLESNFSELISGTHPTGLDVGDQVIELGFLAALLYDSAPTSGTGPAQKLIDDLSVPGTKQAAQEVFLLKMAQKNIKIRHALLRVLFAVRNLRTYDTGGPALAMIMDWKNWNVEDHPQLAPAQNDWPGYDMRQMSYGALLTRRSLQNRPNAYRFPGDLVDANDLGVAKTESLTEKVDIHEAVHWNEQHQEFNSLRARITDLLIVINDEIGYGAADPNDVTAGIPDTDLDKAIQDWESGEGLSYNSGGEVFSMELEQMIWFFLSRASIMGMIVELMDTVFEHAEIKYGGLWMGGTSAAGTPAYDSDSSKWTNKQSVSWTQPVNLDKLSLPTFTVNPLLAAQDGQTTQFTGIGKGDEWSNKDITVGNNSGVPHNTGQGGQGAPKSATGGKPMTIGKTGDKNQVGEGVAPEDNVGGGGDSNKEEYEQPPDTGEDDGPSGPATKVTGIKSAGKTINVSRFNGWDENVFLMQFFDLIVEMVGVYMPVTIMPKVQKTGSVPADYPGSSNAHEAAPILKGFMTWHKQNMVDMLNGINKTLDPTTMTNESLEKLLVEHSINSLTDAGDPLQPENAAYFDFKINMPGVQPYLAGDSFFDQGSHMLSVKKTLANEKQTSVRLLLAIQEILKSVHRSEESATGSGTQPTSHQEAIGNLVGQGGDEAPTAPVLGGGKGGGMLSLFYPTFKYIQLRGHLDDVLIKLLNARAKNNFVRGFGLDILSTLSEGQLILKARNLLQLPGKGHVIRTAGTANSWINKNTGLFKPELRDHDGPDGDEATSLGETVWWDTTDFSTDQQKMALEAFLGRSEFVAAIDTGGSLVDSKTTIGPAGASNMKVLSVGIPTGMMENLRNPSGGVTADGYVSPRFNKNYMYGPMPLLKIKVYRRDFRYPFLIFKPQVFLFNPALFEHPNPYLRHAGIIDQSAEAETAFEKSKWRPAKADWAPEGNLLSFLGEGVNPGIDQGTQYTLTDMALATMWVELKMMEGADTNFSEFGLNPPFTTRNINFGDFDKSFDTDTTWEGDGEPDEEEELDGQFSHGYAEIPYMTKWETVGVNFLRSYSFTTGGDTGTNSDNPGADTYATRSHSPFTVLRPMISPSPDAQRQIKYALRCHLVSDMMKLYYKLMLGIDMDEKSFLTIPSWNAAQIDHWGKNFIHDVSDGGGYEDDSDHPTSTWKEAVHTWADVQNCLFTGKTSAHPMQTPDQEVNDKIAGWGHSSSPTQIRGPGDKNMPAIPKVNKQIAGIDLGTGKNPGISSVYDNVDYEEIIARMAEVTSSPLSRERTFKRNMCATLFDRVFLVAVDPDEFLIDIEEMGKADSATPTGKLYKALFVDTDENGDLGWVKSSMVEGRNQETHGASTMPGYYLKPATGGLSDPELNQFMGGLDSELSLGDYIVRVETVFGSTDISDEETQWMENKTHTTAMTPWYP